MVRLVARVLFAVGAALLVSGCPVIGALLIGDALFEQPSGRTYQRPVKVNMGWHYVGQLEEKGHVLPPGHLYVADKSIRRESIDEKFAWLTVDLAEPTKDGARSLAAISWTNCRTGVIRVTYITENEDRKGEGVAKQIRNLPAPVELNVVGPLIEAREHICGYGS